MRDDGRVEFWIWRNTELRGIWVPEGKIHAPIFPIDFLVEAPTTLATSTGTALRGTPPEESAGGSGHGGATTRKDAAPRDFDSVA